MAVATSPIHISSSAAAIYSYNSTYVYLVSIVVALGGVLFGFDMVIISGTVPFSPYE